MDDGVLREADRDPAPARRYANPRAERATALVEQAVDVIEPVAVHGQESMGGAGADFWPSSREPGRPIQPSCGHSDCGSG